jgi:hypothetical protein
MEVCGYKAFIEYEVDFSSYGMAYAEVLFGSVI